MRRVLLLASFLLVLAGCSRAPVPHADRPRLSSGVEIQDVSFYSNALQREMHYRVIRPRAAHGPQRLPVVYLLHGVGDQPVDWTTHSAVASYAERGLLLVIPQGDNSYYVNAVSKPLFSTRSERYEDYIVTDLIADVEARLPALPGGTHRAAVGISMGGFGAIALALKHPGLFAFVGAMSPPVDVPERRVSWRRWQQSRNFRRLFGPQDSESRRREDPFEIVRRGDPKAAPAMVITCGDREPLLGPVKRFAKLTEERGYPVRFHIVHGAHDWSTWDAALPIVLESLPDLR